MKIAFFSNFLNHHQVFLAEELNILTSGQYTFVETMRIPQWLLDSGYPDLSSDKSYILQAWKDQESYNKALYLCKSADVALFAGYEVLNFEKIRIRETNKLTFEVSERWLKKGVVNIFSPRIMKFIAAYFVGVWFRKNIYKLCSSAFAATDHYRLHTFSNRCYKWGYFTKVEKRPNNHFYTNKIFSCPIKLMWCARFIDWKHPELPVMLAKKLKEKGYVFTINMFGSGEELVKIKRLVESLEVGDVVNFCGNVPNHQILQNMRNHDIFLFTSDKNEGWGTVANEAMSNGCVLVGADAIGSVPFLINDGENGCIFKSCNVDSLVGKVEFLIQNPETRIKMAENAYQSMKNVWSPENAARSLLTLIEDLENNRDTSINNGPCSKAFPI